jgi:uncharacterized protein YxeA
MFISKTDFRSKKEHGSCNAKMDQVSEYLQVKTKSKFVKKWEDVQR